MAKQKTSEPLTGAALLQKVKTLATLSKTQKAKACGYYTVTKSGGERVNLLQFLQALLEAEGIALSPAGEYQVKQFRGQQVIESLVFPELQLSLEQILATVTGPMT